MQWSLFVLILMGQCSFFTCHLYEDVERLTNSSQTTDAWIGLRSINERDIKEWHWSLPGEKYNPSECKPGYEPEWGPEEPNNGGENPENCVAMKPSKEWYDDDCSKTPKRFICYNDKVILIKESKTWDEALTYCREKHHDLVSITDSHQQRWVEKRAKMADTEFVWLGMRYTCTLDLWFWVSNRLVCYDKWAQQETAECGMAVVMKRDGEWHKKADHKKFHFICTK
ncbi:hypothetical protein JOQ06_020230 [Pogonophryne albipinna]|uniref:C-type lectin domain-containing protein n=1 Tax=Pogonophryne albipinna TaxID=1090488 RepID=A0AAD6BNU0_9TELE|nr:hypothetical protein JOQ06_020230 [Pogonophryne albipinna]